MTLQTRQNSASESGPTRTAINKDICEKEEDEEEKKVKLSPSPRKAQKQQLQQ